MSTSKRLQRDRATPPVSYITARLNSVGQQMLKFKTSCAVLAYLSCNLLNEVGLSFFRYFEVSLRVCDIVVKKFTFAISSPDEFLFILFASSVYKRLMQKLCIRFVFQLYSLYFRFLSVVMFSLVLCHCHVFFRSLSFIKKSSLFCGSALIRAIYRLCLSALPDVIVTTSQCKCRTTECTQVLVLSVTLSVTPSMTLFESLSMLFFYITIIHKTIHVISHVA